MTTMNPMDFVQLNYLAVKLCYKLAYNVKMKNDFLLILKIRRKYLRKFKIFQL